MEKSDTVHCLVRFGPKKFIEDFAQHGRLFMNTLLHFQQKEANDALRGDLSEGLNASHPAKGAQISVQIDGHWQPLSNLTGQITFTDQRATEVNIFSLYAITDSTKATFFDSRVLSFGDTAAVVLDGNEFLRRVESALRSRGWEFGFDLVEYVDKNTHSGAMGPFRKYSELAYQSEFRIATSAKINGPVTDLVVGDLRDIVHVGDSASVRSRFKVDPA